MSAAEFGVELAGMFEPPATRHLIERIDGLGFDYLWWADYRFYRDVYSLLTQTALYSDRLRYGTFVTDPFARHPALTAIAMGTADEVGEGRAVLGIGAGISGLTEMGIRRERPAKRISEAIDIIRELWRTGEAHYQGETIGFEGHLDFSPRHDIPIFVASNSPITLSVAGSKADGVIVEGLARPAMLDYVRSHIDGGLAKSERSWSDLHSVARLDLCIADNREAALSMARTRVQHYVSVHGANRWPDLAEFVPPPLEAEIKESGFTHDPDVVQRLADKIPAAAGTLIALAGTPDDVGAQVEKVASLGVDQISVFPIPSAHHGVTVEDAVEHFGTVLRDLGSR